MKSYNRYYRVMNNDTTLIEFSTNNFIPLHTKSYKTIWTNKHPVKVYYSLALQPYHIDLSVSTYHDYADKIVAMEQAMKNNSHI